MNTEPHKEDILALCDVIREIYDDQFIDAPMGHMLLS